MSSARRLSGALSSAVQTLHGKAESALGKEQAAHRAARARMTKAEERIVLERAARQDLELKEAQAAKAASGKVGTFTILALLAFSIRRSNVSALSASGSSSCGHSRRPGLL